MGIFLALLLAYTFSQFYRSFLAVIAGDLGRDLSLGPAELGDVSAAWFVAFALAQFVVGYGLDRFGPRVSLVIGLAIAVTGAAALALANGYLSAIVAMALIGIGCAPVFMAGMYVFGRLYPPDRFALASTVLLGLGSIGNLLGARPLVWAAASFGWRASFLAVATATALVALIVWAVVRDPPPVPAGEDDRSLLGGLRTIAGIRALWLLLPLTITSYAVVIATRALWIGPYLDAVQEFDAAQIGDAALAMGVAMSIGALAYGPLEVRFGAKIINAAGSAAAMLGFFGLAVLGPGRPWAATALLVAIGGCGMTYAILMGHARRFMPVQLLGRGITFMNFAFIGGAGLVQWLSGRFVSAELGRGISATSAYGQLFAAFGAALAAALVVYAFAPARPPTPTLPEPAP